MGPRPTQGSALWTRKPLKRFDPNFIFDLTFILDANFILNQSFDCEPDDGDQQRGQHIEGFTIADTQHGQA